LGAQNRLIRRKKQLDISHSHRSQPTISLNRNANDCRNPSKTLMVNLPLTFLLLLYNHKQEQIALNIMTNGDSLMKKTAMALIGCFFAVAFFATAHSSEHEYRYDNDRYEYREGHDRDDDDRHEYREGRERHDDDRHEYRGNNERYSDDRHESRGRHDRHDDDRYEHRRYAYDD
jgi:hypothetical protein